LGRAFADRLQCLLRITHRRRQQPGSRFGRSTPKLAQLVPAPSEQNVRIEAMTQSDAGNRGAGNQRELDQVTLERLVVLSPLGAPARQN